MQTTVGITQTMTGVTRTMAGMAQTRRKPTAIVAPHRHLCLLLPTFITPVMPYPQCTLIPPLQFVCLFIYLFIYLH
jgi:hypothetical protein